ncbi:hypothetical protein DFH07DRAFT_513475 [Mycena maculata]|uniref:Uncharacterized protein n=1 Tax=Mycena maculata TaxID=230809 RepID=A0AAD7IZ37_9AGAR|nr:hypothetical protein DFH07DRAFT_513475 [Mycena maculata]
MLSRSVHMSCMWYRTGGGGKISSIFPGAGPSGLFWLWTRPPRWSDYKVEVEGRCNWKRLVRREKIKRLTVRALYLTLASALVFSATQRTWFF